MPSRPCSGHIVTTHVHDNNGQRDDHLVPGHGTIDWEGVMMAFQKVGYDGAWIFELAPAARLARRARTGRGVRTRLERLLHQRAVTPAAERTQSTWRHTSTSTASETTSGRPSPSRGGWHNRRSSGKIHFLLMRDGTGFLQVVMGKSDVGDETFARADHLAQESAIEVTGVVRADQRAKGGYELTATGMTVVALAQDFPITPKEHGVDYLMDRRHLWIRTRAPDGDPARAPRGD